MVAWLLTVELLLDSKPIKQEKSVDVHLAGTGQCGRLAPAATIETPLTFTFSVVRDRDNRYLQAFSARINVVGALKYEEWHQSDVYREGRF